MYKIDIKLPFKINLFATIVYLMLSTAVMGFTGTLLALGTTALLCVASFAAVRVQPREGPPSLKDTLRGTSHLYMMLITNSLGVVVSYLLSVFYTHIMETPFPVVDTYLLCFLPGWIAYAVIEYLQSAKHRMSVPPPSTYVLPYKALITKGSLVLIGGVLSFHVFSFIQSSPNLFTKEALHSLLWNTGHFLIWVCATVWSFRLLTRFMLMIEGNKVTFLIFAVFFLLCFALTPSFLSITYITYALLWAALIMSISVWEYSSFANMFVRMTLKEQTQEQDESDILCAIKIALLETNNTIQGHIYTVDLYYDHDGGLLEPLTANIYLVNGEIHNREAFIEEVNKKLEDICQSVIVKRTYIKTQKVDISGHSYIVNKVRLQKQDEINSYKNAFKSLLPKLSHRKS
jgi:hypothetical protein